MISIWVNPQAEHSYTMALWASRGPRWFKQWRKHCRRCAWCNPGGNPPPIAGKFAPGPKAARMRRRPR